MANKSFIVDMSKHEAFGKHAILCDSCLAQVSSPYSSDSKTITMHMKKPGSDGENNYKTDHHFCSAKCALNFLNKHSKKEDEKE